jgi:hypothetical protein
VRPGSGSVALERPPVISTTSSARTIRRPFEGRTAAAAAGSTRPAGRAARPGRRRRARLEPGPHRGVGAREVQLVEDGAHVAARAADQERHDACGAQPVDLGAGHPRVLGHRRRLAHVPEVEQVVRHAVPLAGVGLGGADVHAAVQLHRVGVDHLAAEPVRQGDSEGGLAGGGGAHQRDHRRGTAHRTPQSATR